MCLVAWDLGVIPAEGTRLASPRDIQFAHV